MRTDDMLDELLDARDIDAIEGVLVKRRTTAEQIQKIYNWCVYCEAAIDIDTDKSYLLMAAHRHTPSNVLVGIKGFAYDSLVDGPTDLEIELMIELAKNPNTPVTILVDMANDNITTPPEVLAILADNADVNTRVAVAKNLRTPSGALAKLSNDQSERVRAGAVWNKNIRRI